MNQKGFTIIEIVAATALLGFVLFVFSGLVKNQWESSEKHRRQVAVDGDLAQAQKFIRRLGRVATACVRTDTGGVVALECDVDFNTPPTGAVTLVRFIRQGNFLLYQHAGVGAGTWNTKLRYSGVSQFVVCDSAMMTAATCAINPGGISIIGDAASPRFFRYALTSVDSVYGAEGVVYPGAFFVRNPSPLDPNLVYQWGGG